MTSKRLTSSLPTAGCSSSNEIAGFAERVDTTLDIRGEKCPITFVRIKLELEKMRAGENLKVLLDGGEPMQNVPRQVKEEGHKIIKVERLSENRFTLLIRKDEGRRHG
jgi:tRNA 2-thiouridine synthesizing protein A